MINKFIVLNGGPATNRSFVNALPEINVECHKTSRMILHITQSAETVFISEEKPVLFEDAYVFTRYHTIEYAFSGLLHHYLHDTHIPFAHPVLNRYPGANEKIAQMPILARNGIQVPETIICKKSSAEANSIYLQNHITFPVVFKRNGSRGESVFLLHSSEELKAHIEASPDELCIIQRYHPAEYDIRVLVAYGKVLGAIKRSQPDSFYNNISKGADAFPYEVTESERQLCINAAHACGIDFAGVDFLHSANGKPLFLEVNSGPQIAGFQRVYGKGLVFKEIAAILRERNFQ